MTTRPDAAANTAADTDRAEAAPAVAEELLELAVGLAHRAGELAVSMRAEAVAEGATATKSTSTDLVTAADKASEELIVSGILAARPTDGVLGEEGNDIDGSSGVRWIIDPIDGTTNYVYGIEAFCVSIAAEVDGVVVAGVVHDPVRLVDWTATLGGGSFRDDVRLELGTPPPLPQALVATGFGYDAGRRRDQARILLSLLPEVRDVRRFGAAAMDLCAVAEGRVDAYFEKGLNPWDLAAGALVATEAGAVVDDLLGGPPGPDFTLAAPPALHDALGRRLRGLRAREIR